MSLSDIRSECSDVAGLLQPYVDGELPDEEQERVAAHLAGCKGCRAAVTEQAWVRATLRAIPREPAPQAVRAKILLALDDVDRERAEEAAAALPPVPAPGLWSRMWRRFADLGRGGLIMVPAGAAAIGLFFVVKDASVPAASEVAPAAAPVGIGGALSPGTKAAAADVAHDDDPTAALSQLQPQVGFEPQVPGPTPSDDEVQLVGAGVDGSAANAARLRFELLRSGRPTGHHLIDRQRPASGIAPPGELVSVGGRDYHFERDASGTAVLHFVVGQVAHTVRLEGPARLEMTGDLVDDSGRRRPADVSALLWFAQRFRADGSY